MNEKFEIKATYERIAYQKTEDPAAVTYHDQSLRVDSRGIIPRDTSKILLQINIDGEGVPHRVSVPPEFARLGYFIIMATLLPFRIDYGTRVMVSIVEADGREILAQRWLLYRTA
jgi:hypothetical protein